MQRYVGWDPEFDARYGETVLVSGTGTLTVSDELKKAAGLN